ncbi:lasso peptide biosynthesis B2 protein [Kitasatospora sp. NBC_01287]|uniref:lasso peptide biosynthesis B2 protein n=1 Tax=Kitasatospora sp. NBC_01287 TaxID=2903573 RepID=UPI002259A135|nr:lasso peptide biosynthesis B2 protein [Kitasatospora sp. NBC_01287]MCX4745306.1 lasso peptide biosynthesis B2 protein [Kitasatospora sp. NBC_01287]
MSDLPTFAVPPLWVRAADFGHVLVLIDYRTGKIQGLLPAAAERFRQAARTGCLDPLSEQLASQLLDAKLLTPASAACPWPVTEAATATGSWGSAEFPAGATRPKPVSRPALINAAGAVAAVASIKAAGSRSTTMLRVVRTVHWASSTCRRPATLEQAAAAVFAVRAAGWCSPARTACLEESIAVVLLLAARRLAVTWCHGVAADPVRLHAWVQTEDGTPVAEPLSTRAYTPILTLGARHHRQP